MSQVVRQDIDALNAQIIVTLSASDYGKKIQDQIKKYSKNAQIKGFRPGKTPIALVKKMLGKSFMIDIINDEVSEALTKYLETNKEFAYLGQPILAEKQEPMSLDIDNLKDVVTKFDVGLEPQIELQGLNKDTVLPFYSIIVDEELVDEEVRKIRKNSSTEHHLEQIESETDYISLTVVFSKDGEERDHTFGILAEDLTEDARALLDTKKVGDMFMYNLYNLENESTDDNVKTYFLGLEKNADVSGLGTEFELILKSITNRKVPELNQAFFDQYFGENAVTSEEEMRAVLRHSLVAQKYAGHIDALLFRNLQEMLIEKNSFELPEAFLKRWLLTADEKNTPQTIENEFDAFLANLRWTLIRRKIVELSKVKVTKEILLNYYKARIRSYLGGIENPEVENMLANRVMEDEKQANDLIEDYLTDVVFNYTRHHVTLVPDPISAEDFDAMIAKMTNKEHLDESEEMPIEVTEEIGA
jgi:trigger factor